MSTRKQNAVEHDETNKLGYDVSDVSIGLVGKTMWWFFAFTTALIAIALVVQYYMVGSIGPKEAAARRKLPPEPNPLLQTDITAAQDMARVRNAEIQGLASYGWVDREKGVAHIPIERAIEIKAAQMALPPGGAR